MLCHSMAFFVNRASASIVKEFYHKRNIQDDYFAICLGVGN